MKIKINITKEILEKSKMCNTEPGETMIGHNCAIALAVREVLPNCWVATHDIIRSYCDSKVIALLPKEATDFILEFDSRTPEQRILLPEFRFEIEVEDSEILDSIEITELKEILKKSKTLELIENA